MRDEAGIWTVSGALVTAVLASAFVAAPLNIADDAGNLSGSPIRPTSLW